VITNVEKIATAIAKGAKHISILPIPTTPYWLVTEKLEENRWKLVICSPFGYKFHTLSDCVNIDSLMIIVESLIKIRSPMTEESYLLK